MSHHGDIRLGDTIDIAFTTVAATGAPTVLAGPPLISAYVGNSLTQITAGITLSADFDGVVGLNNVRVVASGDARFGGALGPLAIVLAIATAGLSQYVKNLREASEMQAGDLAGVRQLLAVAQQAQPPADPAREKN